MAQRTREEEAKRLYEDTQFHSWLLLLTLGTFAVMAMLVVIDTATDFRWKLLSSGGAIVMSFQAPWLLASHKIAAWRVRRAGLSQEADVVELYPDARARAALFFQSHEPFEMRPVPSRLASAAASIGGLAGLAALSYALWALLDWSVAPILALMAPLCTILFALVGARLIYNLFYDPPEFRADASGVWGSWGMLPRRVLWSDVDSLRVMRHYGVAGTLGRTDFVFLDASGAAICAMSPPLEGRNFLRDACSEPGPLAST